MNPQLLDDHQENSHVEAGEGVGRRLRAARIDRGLALDQIAAQLHLNPSLVEALEAGRYEALPGPVFVAGYIRNYARQVGLDPEPLMAAYVSAKEQAEPGPVWAQPRTTRGGRGGGAFLIRLMTVLLVAGVAYLFVQWWQNRAPTVSELAGQPTAESDREVPEPAPDLVAPKAETPPAPRIAAPNLGQVATAVRHDAPPPPTIPTAVTVVSVTEAAMPPTAQAPSPETSGTDAAPAADASEATGASEGVAQHDPGEATTDEGDVVLEFRGPCWVDVRDSAKSFSLTGEMSKGDRRVLEGTPPYSLILGNASAVTVTVKGAPFDVSRVTKGNVARFKLDPAALP